MLKLSTAITIALMLLPSMVRADGGELRPLYRGARAMGMGGAFIAVADDEQTIFYNPAGMANIKTYEVHYATVDIEASQDFWFAYQNAESAFTNPGIETLNSLMGYNLYSRGTLTSSIVMPNFGFSLIVDAQGGFYGLNQALPRFTLGYQNTNGIQFATGFSLLGRRPSTRPRADLRFGVGAKALYRRGGFKEVPITFLVDLSGGRGVLSPIIGNYELGFGADVGFHYFYPFNRSASFSLGAAFTDIGDTSFVKDADPIQNNLGLGASFKYEPNMFRFLLAYDYTHILQKTDWRQKNHLGGEIGIPALRLYGGLNQVYLTFGFVADLVFMKFYAVSYAQELGVIVRQRPNRRYLFRFDFNFTL